MSLRPDGHYHCDRCGLDVGNAGVQEATFISRLDPDDPTNVLRLHLCLIPIKGAPRGCTGLALGPVTLANYYETRNA